MCRAGRADTVVAFQGVRLSPPDAALSCAVMFAAAPSRFPPVPGGNERNTNSRSSTRLRNEYFFILRTAPPAPGVFWTSVLQSVGTSMRTLPMTLFSPPGSARTVASNRRSNEVTSGFIGLPTIRQNISHYIFARTNRGESRSGSQNVLLQD